MYNVKNACYNTRGKIAFSHFLLFHTSVLKKKKIDRKENGKKCHQSVKNGCLLVIFLLLFSIFPNFMLCRWVIFIIEKDLSKYIAPKGEK